MTPEQWRNSGQQIVINGRQVFVRSVGQGKTILTPHAFPTSSYDFSRIAPFLAGHYQLILFDYPGFGFSDKPRSHAYSLFEYADTLQAVAAHLGIQHAFLLAHDIGDSVALITLMRQALQIDKLVMMNGSVISIPFDDPLMRATQRILLHRILGPLIGQLGLINKHFFASTARQLFSYPLPKSELDAFWSIITYNNGAPLYPILMRYMRERWRHQYQWLNALEEHHVPLTLIWGQADPVATPLVADAVITRRPDASYLRLEGVGHYPHWEQPKLVAAAIIDAFG